MPLDNLAVRQAYTDQPLRVRKVGNSGNGAPGLVGLLGSQYRVQRALRIKHVDAWIGIEPDVGDLKRPREVLATFKKCSGGR